MATRWMDDGYPAELEIQRSQQRADERRRELRRARDRERWLLELAGDVVLACALLGVFAACLWIATVFA